MKKNPMFYEIKPIIQLLKIIQNNIMLLDPLDQDSQRSMNISVFKDSVVTKL